MPRMQSALFPFPFFVFQFSMATQLPTKSIGYLPSLQQWVILCTQPARTMQLQRCGPGRLVGTGYVSSFYHLTMGHDWRMKMLLFPWERHKEETYLPLYIYGNQYPFTIPKVIQQRTVGLVFAACCAPKSN